MARLSGNGKVIIINSRWGKKDLIGELLKNNFDIRYINVKALTGNVSFCPELFPVSRLLDMKNKIGHELWSALYQGE